VLAALAALAALLAADVRAWGSSLSSGDAAYAVSPATATWTPSTRLGGVAESLLGVRDDVEFRGALQLYLAAVSTRQRLDNAVEVQSLRAQAEAALTGPAASADPSRAAQARTLLGILSFGGLGAGGGASQTDAAISSFTDAVRADPDIVLAKFDLELLLRLTTAHGARPGPGQGGGFGRTGHRGAGGGVAGSGY
jgi:hypothetical protein